MIAAHLVTSMGVGGTERQVTELLRGLSATRWQSRLALFRPTGALLPDVAALGLSPVSFPLHGTLAQMHTVRVIHDMARWLRREGAELLHCHDADAALVGVPAARVAGVPVIASRRDLAHHLTPLRRIALRGALHMSTVVLANSLTVAAQAHTEDGVPAHRLIVVPNGLDLARFDAVAALHRPAPPLADSPIEPFQEPGRITIMTVARMIHPAKGHDDLLAAAALVVARAPEARFILIGDGPREPELRAAAARLGKAVVFLGRRADVPALLRRADVVCHPARAEGLPNAVIEAMAAERPIVAAAAGGIPELIHDGVHGLLVPSHDPPALAAALLRVLADPASARRRAAAARARVAERYTLGALVTRIDHLYNRLTGRAGA